jgi:hypothetical protein
MPKPSDASAPFEMNLTIHWSKANPIERRPDKKLDFGAIPELPGVYRIHCQMPPGPKRVYIGEARDLKTRITNYSRARKIAAGPVSPNRGMNRRLRNYLSRKGGQAQILVAAEAKVSVGGGRTRRLRMAKKFHRLLTENAAIVYQLMYTDNIVINAAAPDRELK